MASSTEFLLGGDAATAHGIVTDALTGAGFRFEAVSPGWWKISRGDMTKTVLLGALAGKNFHISFLLAFGVAPDGNPTVRLDRDLGVGAVKGGAIGVSKTATAYAQTLDLIGNATTAAGIFLGNRELA